MSWRRLRLGVFTVIGAALLSLYPFVRAAGDDRVGSPLLLAFVSLGALMAAAVAFDVAYHARRSEGQACRSCGHLRRMKPFRIYGACPNCGEE